MGWMKPKTSFSIQATIQAPSAIMLPTEFTESVFVSHVDVDPKNRGKPPKMDGEFIMENHMF